MHLRERASATFWEFVGLLDWLALLRPVLHLGPILALVRARHDNTWDLLDLLHGRFLPGRGVFRVLVQEEPPALDLLDVQRRDELKVLNGPCPCVPQRLRIVGPRLIEREPRREMLALR